MMPAISFSLVSLLIVLLLLVGMILFFLGVLGLLRFPDVFQRLHATAVSDSIASYLIVVGLALLTPDWWLFAKVLCVGLFLGLSTPLSTQALARSAIALLPAHRGHKKSTKEHH